MEPGIIKLAKRVTLDNSTTDEDLIRIRLSAYDEFKEQVFALRLHKISQSDLAIPGLAHRIIQCNTSISLAISGEINRKFKYQIPELVDETTGCNLKYVLPDHNLVPVSILTADPNTINDFEIAIHFTTKEFIFLGSLGNEHILLAHPLVEEQNNPEIKSYSNTFLLKITKGLNISFYNKI